MGYDELLLELLAALGAALFFGNLVAFVRRRRDRRTATTTRPRPHDAKADLPEAPVARTLLYMALGFVVMVWALGSLLA